ncbi:N5-carboxyaminoimidazole ribonucleotide mutase [Candidatus Nitrosocosmicus arcticus]|uniref:N5-carboxyaminoimidazole ribonucleotide mutase n=2 Tax=Candidatus Nitrosocosmicus arcticus TaxID=2035267 RepID=A0A557SUD1_9ARCH|nr:5-(carboxyamino)imidazole ribonucleotide mutase [Candidatus Nitrosocosmicus arcticus]TVP40216.1 N5-carboxyaminoimidazole ribonucleotide mutase [Candidatus Nitrosocosmicus arcticus]
MSKSNPIKNKSKNISEGQPDISESVNLEKNTSPIVGIIMGSDSDLPIMKEAARILNEFEISYEVKIVSAHRTPVELFEYSQTAEIRGIKIIISGAGGSAHLPGMVASMTSIPVIGVPINNSANPLNGIDSLYSIIQMPPGIPVATVAINGAKNAGILACSILSISQPSLLRKLNQFKEKMRAEVKLKNAKLDEVGLDKYLKGLQKAQTRR